MASFHRKLKPQGALGAVLLSIVCLTFPLLSHAVGLPALSDFAQGRFTLGAQVVMLDNNRIIAQENPTAMMTPASLSKLYVASASLNRYGPQHRFTTRFTTAGNVRGSVLDGDLYVEGGGDPAMTTDRYWSLVQQLRAAGIERINGRVILSQWPFGPEPCISQDRCNARYASSNSYDARLSSVAVDYAAWCTRIIPTMPGAEARVAGCFGAQPLLGIRGSVKTVSDGQSTAIGARRVTSNGEDVLQLSGRISTGDGPQSIFRSASDPASETLSALRQLFQQSGIRVANGFQTVSRAAPGGATTIASLDSPPLQMALMDMMNYSNNFMADTLTIDMSATSPASLASGTAALERFVDRIPGHGPLTLLSGSGLTPENKTSARGLVALLNYMYHRPELFPTLYAAMQTPYNGAAHHIRHGSELFQRSVMVKTGTLNEPEPVRAIAGYFRTQSGRWGAFAVMLSGQATRPPYLTWPNVMDAVAEDMSDIIRQN